MANLRVRLTRSKNRYNCLFLFLTPTPSTIHVKYLTIDRLIRSRWFSIHLLKWSLGIISMLFHCENQQHRFSSMNKWYSRETRIIWELFRQKLKMSSMMCRRFHLVVDYFRSFIDVALQRDNNHLKLSSYTSTFDICQSCHSWFFYEIFYCQIRERFINEVKDQSKI